MIEQLWRTILAANEIGRGLVASHEVDDIVALMIGAKIDPRKFSGNLSALTARGMLTITDLFDTGSPALPTTPSVAQYISLVNRPPQAPLWFLAGFPDVLAWLNEQQEKAFSPVIDEDESAIFIAGLYGLDPGFAKYARDEGIGKPDGSLSVHNYRNLVRSYLKQVGQGLEAAVKEGSDDDIYLGHEFLDMVGEESNFTLIATVTTKYYLELKTNYASAFPDETSLLAMSGILDANMYILVSGAIQPREIVDLAKATEGERDRLLKFIVNLEALLLSADAPEVPPEDVLEACREQVDAIRKSIHKAMAIYRDEPKIIENSRAVMRSTKFHRLRRAAGARAPSLVSRFIGMMVG